jgi:hypothetical protein
MLALTIAAALAFQNPAKPALEPFDVLCRQAPQEAYVKSWKWLDLPVKAVCLSDTDGGRQVPITAEQIQRGLVFANAAYAPARIRFKFDPNKDLLRVKSTLLNQTEAGDADANGMCQEVAEKFPGYAVLYFRWGAGKGATGGCYSGFAGKYVMMVQYWESPPPVPQTVWLIGHEVGHYLGLDHPFGRGFSKLSEAEAFFKENKDDPKCFDGDGLADTGPDPCIGEVSGDVKIRTIKLNGKELKLDRENLMNYTGSLYKTVSRTQALRMRWSVENKVHRLGSDLPSNKPGPRAILFKDLKATEKKDSEPFTTPEAYESGIMHGGGRVTCYAKPGAKLTYDLPERPSGAYDATLYAYTSTDLGVIRILIDGKPVGKPIDLWNPVTYMPTGAIPLGRFNLKGGPHRVTVEVVGKNNESSNFHWSIEALDLQPAK